MTALADLPALYTACERVLSGGISRRPRETRAAGPSHGLPFNGAAADVRAEIVTCLSSWSGLVADGRHLTAPQRSVQVLAGFLHRNADRLAAHPAVAEATEEIARLTRRARRVAYPDQAGRLWSAPTGTVYRLASQQRRRRRSRAGRTYYAESDVRVSFSRRAGLSSAP
ncbi:hypothetical protein [Actinacidiphila bryophytorum]|uniref:hypothetical protein n=1 Tax=Actinacidiphila bryophytorum TaxID=1436133 RepID=UPI00197F37A2|nr:hypothetical protein [Actinacidiphila bryophytorum]MBN6543658.1 hypothetical protein [Actinacidiphila bryophytorum]